MKKESSGMIDNKMTHSTRQRGIERVMQKGGESGRVGQPGKMTGKGHANWKKKRKLNDTKKRLISGFIPASIALLAGIFLFFYAKFHRI